MLNIGKREECDEYFVERLNSNFYGNFRCVSLLSDVVMLSLESASITIGSKTVIFSITGYDDVFGASESIFQGYINLAKREYETCKYAPYMVDCSSLDQ